MSRYVPGGSDDNRRSRFGTRRSRTFRDERQAGFLNEVAPVLRVAAQQPSRQTCFREDVQVAEKKAAKKAGKKKTRRSSGLTAAWAR